MVFPGTLEGKKSCSGVGNSRPWIRDPPRKRSSPEEGGVASRRAGLTASPGEPWGPMPGGTQQEFPPEGKAQRCPLKLAPQRPALRSLAPGGLGPASGQGRRHGGREPALGFQPRAPCSCPAPSVTSGQASGLTELCH